MKLNYNPFKGLLLNVTSNINPTWDETPLSVFPL